MKRFLILLSVCLLSFNGFAQKNPKYTENDAKQFYRTIQGDYIGQLNDSTTLIIHFTPIWEREDDRFHWLYMEAMIKETKMIVEQSILEIKPVSDISFKVIAHALKSPERFVGRWGNPNFFDGFNTSIFRRRGQFRFVKTKDFEYQTRWNNRKTLTCFPMGDKIHFKFVQEDECLYVKRLLAKSSRIIGYTFFKELTD